MKDAWFKNGLRFKCTECGKCCTGAPGCVWVSEEEIIAMAEELDMEIETFCKRYIRQIDGRLALKELPGDSYACVFLQGKRCRVYRTRPKQCRTFPWWQHNLSSKEAWLEAAKDCEGINDEAPLHTYEEIMKQMSE